MSTAVPQDILDGLTRVEMPGLPPVPDPSETITIDGHELPRYRAGVAVVGSGAAGLRAAVESARRGLDVVLVTASPYGGTSACSGSDKQTLHTVGTSNRGDDYRACAAAIGGGGCMDADAAYIEAAGSIQALGGLQYLGLPLPTDRFGAVLRYQTDHDEAGRATSCGPRTSRLMVKVLAAEAVRLGIPCLRQCEAVRLLTTGPREDRCCAGVLAVDRSDGDGHRLCVVQAGAVVLATGGPGELYRDSVYPAGCFGSLGMALEAGIEAVNLTESQFGISTRRQDFPWNLSGTYVQVIPYIYSVDPDGAEHNFLADYYRTTRETASNVFRKGYQWPFHATRMQDYGSSLVDLAIARECAAGRTVYMDFNRNPEPGADGEPFSLDDLDDDVRAYLANNNALDASPIARLKRMNPLAIELYRMHGHDLEREPLAFNVNNQHMNGGIVVDIWNRTSLPGCYAVGEVAGTHGVTRPGGAALNAGQVGGIRCAEHLAVGGAAAPAGELPEEVARQVIAACALVASPGDAEAPSVPEVRAEIQTRMSDEAGFICRIDRIPAALAAARKLRLRLEREGFRPDSFSHVEDIFRWRHLALLSEAVLTVIDGYLARGGGSRGARAYCAPDGEGRVDTVQGPLDDYRFRPENPPHREHKLVARFDGAEVHLEERPLRGIEDLDAIYFEKNWPAYLTDAIHREDFRH